MTGQLLTQAFGILAAQTQSSRHEGLGLGLGLRISRLAAWIGSCVFGVFGGCLFDFLWGCTCLIWAKQERVLNSPTIGGSEPEGQQSCPGELKISKSFARSVHVKPVGFWEFLEVCWMPKKVSVRRMLQFGLRVL